MQAVYDWMVAHPTLVSLTTYHILAAFVGSLEMPNDQSGMFYRWFFRFVNRLAANYTRAQASSTVLGSKPPKPANVPPSGAPPIPKT
jgi:hypothetical protein